MGLLAGVIKKNISNRFFAFKSITMCDSSQYIANTFQVVFSYFSPLGVASLTKWDEAQLFYASRVLSCY